MKLLINGTSYELDASTIEDIHHDRTLALWEGIDNIAKLTEIEAPYLTVELQEDGVTIDTRDIELSTQTDKLDLNLSAYSALFTRQDDWFAKFSEQTVILSHPDYPQARIIFDAICSKAPNFGLRYADSNKITAIKNGTDTTLIFRYPPQRMAPITIELYSGGTAIFQFNEDQETAINEIATINPGNIGTELYCLINGTRYDVEVQEVGCGKILQWLDSCGSEKRMVVESYRVQQKFTQTVSGNDVNDTIIECDIAVSGAEAEKLNNLLKSSRIMISDSSGVMRAVTCENKAGVIMDGKMNEQKFKLQLSAKTWE